MLQDGPFTEEITLFPIPHSLEKPPSFELYDRTGDPEEHIGRFDTIMRYRNARGPVKCKLFPLTLSKIALAWFQGLKPNSIGSWSELSRKFSYHFTTSRPQPKSEATLAAIRQGENESLRKYIESFTQEAMLAGGVREEMKMYLLQQGLIKKSLFHVDIGVHRPRDYNDLLRRAERFIGYEDECKLTDRGEVPQVKGSGHKEPKAKKEKDNKSSINKFTEYTPLNTSRAHILEECLHTEFKEAGIKLPSRLKQRPDTDKTKYCLWHRSNGHNTEDCFQLKDVVKQLIQ